MVDLKYRYWLTGLLVAVAIVGAVTMLRSSDHAGDPLGLAAALLEEPVR